MTVGNASVLGALTERSPFGMLRVQRSYTRYNLTPSRLYKSSRALSSCPVIKAQSLRLTSTQRNRSVSRSYQSTSSFADLGFISPHWWKGWYHDRRGNRTGNLRLNDSTLPATGHSGNVDALSSLARIIWYTVDKTTRKHSANPKLYSSSKIKTWNDLGHLFHVPHILTTANRISVLVSTSDLDPVC